MNRQLLWCAVSAVLITLPGARLVIPATQLPFKQLYTSWLGLMGFVFCFFLMAPGMAVTWPLLETAPWVSIIANVILWAATLYGIAAFITRKRAKHHGSA